MIIFANAKINLGLFILSKREDGYHNIASLKFPIPIHDVLEILPSVEFKLTVVGKEIAGNMEDNLVYKAYKIIADHHAIPPVHIVLQKNIPMGAGIGGGSADATFTLKGLNDFFQLKLSSETLKKYAANLGSDCPFFVENIPQLAFGKGDELQSFDLDLKGKFLYLIHPDIHVGTAEAYANVHPKMTEFNWEDLKSKNISEWKSILINDFEDSIFPNYPEIKALKENLYLHGASFASMSGSGSSVFGVFEKKPEAIFPEYASQFICEL